MLNPQALARVQRLCAAPHSASSQPRRDKIIRYFALLAAQNDE
jgi:hypothetical protein